MRKFILLLCIWLFSTETFAQFQLGFQFVPTLSANRVEYTNNTFNLASDGTALKIIMGPFLDFSLTDNYVVSTGILFSTKRSAFELQDKSGNFAPIKASYQLQYIQLPATLKLYTNEVALDKKLYFQIGGNFEFLIDEKTASPQNFIVEDFRLFDVSLFSGLGVEYQLGISTTIFSGFTYQRGLINTIGKSAVLLGNDISAKNDLFGLIVGVKF